MAKGLGSGSDASSTPHLYSYHSAKPLLYHHVALDLLLLFCVLTLSSGGKEETEDPPLCFFPVSGKHFFFLSEFLQEFSLANTRSHGVLSCTKCTVILVLSPLSRERTEGPILGRREGKMPGKYP